MNKLLIAVAAALVGLSACSSERMPTNVELATLLQQDGSDQGGDGANRALDPLAVQCLAAQSGDTDLAHDISAAALSDVAKSQCRRRLDLWLADAKRNPGKFRFEEISTPHVAKQAMRMYLDNGGTPFVQPGDEPKRASQPVNPVPAVISDSPAPDADKVLAQADNLCREAKAAVARGPFNARVQRYADSCESTVAATRAKMEQYRQQNRQSDIDAEARKLSALNESGQKFLSHSSGG